MNPDGYEHTHTKVKLYFYILDNQNNKINQIKIKLLQKGSTLEKKSFNE